MSCYAWNMKLHVVLHVYVCSCVYISMYAGLQASEHMLHFSQGLFEAGRGKVWETTSTLWSEREKERQNDSLFLHTDKARKSKYLQKGDACVSG